MGAPVLDVQEVRRVLRRDVGGRMVAPGRIQMPGGYDDRQFMIMAVVVLVVGLLIALAMNPAMLNGLLEQPQGHYSSQQRRYSPTDERANNILLSSLCNNCLLGLWAA